MTDFFKSAFGLFGNNSNAASAGSAGLAGPASNHNLINSPSSEFVGQTILIGHLKLKITKLLAEGF